MLNRFAGAVCGLAAMGGGLLGICQAYAHRFTLPHTVSNAVGSSFLGMLLVKLMVIALAAAMLAGFIGFLAALFAGRQK